MKIFLYSILTLVLSSVYSIVSASGLDLTLLYGSRYVALGGTQVSLSGDAYGPFYNPATMTGVNRFALALDSSNLVTQYEAPIGGTARDSDIGWGPLFYVGSVYRLSDQIVFGIGIYPTALQGGKFSHVAYGTGNLADKESSNRLVRIEFAPSVAVKMAEHFSLGASYRFGYTRYEKAGGIFTAVHLDSTLSNWDAKGFKAGAFLNDWHGFSAGLTYRIRTDLQLDGNTTLTSPTATVDFSSTQQISIPAQLQVGVTYEWIPKKFLSVICYEYTWNDMIVNDTTTSPGIGAVLGTGSDDVTTPLHYKNGHTLHVGTEYVFELSKDNNLRTGVGLGYDKAVTREGKPVPALAPAADYYGGAIGAQWEQKTHTYGVAFNYGQYSSTSSSIDADVIPGTVFPGKYSLKSFLAVLDYQWKF